MLNNMALIFQKVWTFLSMEIQIDEFQFALWHPFAFSIIISLILKMIISDIDWYWSYKLNEHRMEVMRNRKYTPWYEKQQVKQTNYKRFKS